MEKITKRKLDEIEGGEGDGQGDGEGEQVDKVAEGADGQEQGTGAAQFSEMMVKSKPTE